MLRSLWHPTHLGTLGSEKPTFGGLQGLRAYGIHNYRVWGFKFRGLGCSGLKEVQGCRAHGPKEARALGV